MLLKVNVALDNSGGGCNSGGAAFISNAFLGLFGEKDAEGQELGEEVIGMRDDGGSRLHLLG